MGLLSLPDEIICEIMDYLQIEIFLPLKQISKKMLTLAEDFQQQKSKNFISKLKRHLK